MGTFKNSRDKDIEFFLQEKAIDFKENKRCNTFLLINENNRIEGYFTLSLKILSFDKKVSKTLRKKLNNGFDTNSIPVILIGQLGKYIDQEKNEYGDTSAEDLLFYAIQVIEEINKLVPCRCVLIECAKDRKKLKELYVSLGFTEIEGDYKYIQLIKKLK